MAENIQKENQIVLKGLLEAINLHEGTYYHSLMLPAFDAYSRPSPVNVASPTKLGAIGDVVVVTCNINSYTRKFQTKTGEAGLDYKTRFDVVK